MVLASSSVLIVEWAPQNGYRQHLCPQGESQFPLASLGGSLKSSGSDPGSFQITAFALGLRSCEILCVPFESGSLLFPTTLWLSWKQAPLAFKTRCSGGLSYQCRSPGLGSPIRGSDRSLLGENICNCDYLPICVSPNLVVWVLIIPCLCPLLPIL